MANGMETTMTAPRSAPAGRAAESDELTPEAAQARVRRREERSLLIRLLKPLASLKFTIALFAMAVFITYAGTVAQMRAGVWTVVDEIFRHAMARIEIASLFLYAWDIPGHIYFPGGWLIGGAMLVNLLAAHAVRFKTQATGSRLLAGVTILALGCGFTGLVLAGYLQTDIATSSTDAFWRVLWRLWQGAMAGIILYLGSWMVFRKRAGIVLLHAGIILLFVSELITGLFAVEGRMILTEGETADYVDHAFDFELAVIDGSQAEHDVVTVVPADNAFRSGGRITHELLPFDLKVEQWFDNSTMPAPMESVGEPMKAQHKATAGEGRGWLILPQGEGVGVDVGAKVDSPGAYVTFYEKGSDKPLGTYLFSLWFYPNFSQRFMDVPQTLTAGGKSYQLYLRNQREYLTSADGRKPFSLHLIDFRHELYPGTKRPKDFSSYVQLTDPDRNVDRELRIWMNNPLRYAGRTFYQSGWLPNDSGTVLAVVRNVGWMVPYVSCMIVAVGMIGHFGRYLVEFLRKRALA